MFLLKLRRGSHLREDALAQWLLLRLNVGTVFEVCHCYTDRGSHARCGHYAGINEGSSGSSLGGVGSDQSVEVLYGLLNPIGSRRRVIDIVCACAQFTRFQHVTLLKKRPPRSAPYFDKMFQAGAVIPQFAPEARLAL
ncbi:hypothetical protein [Caulobacter segnis]|uniref:hypothetical protein n=1 Tax=Caulobacter segnis TaxID=88688 RepID=UPI0028649E55|nr:hypothetical protein [Caulobacter segnis]MDR6624699.1 hypothetical protein [Caulobacter segnis]